MSNKKVSSIYTLITLLRLKKIGFVNVEFEVIPIKETIHLLVVILT